ncbi:MAG: prepilin peptidase [bacterium]|nr:prepilin peptidase [bacterium]
MENTIFYIMVGMFSPILASFLSVVIYRVPRSESIVFPGSHCGACDKRLGVLDLIPILSWIINRGSCRHCGAKVPVRYLLLELLVPALMLTAAFYDGPTLLFARDALFITLLVILSFIDLDTMELPHRFTMTGIVAGIAFSIAFGARDLGPMWPDAILGAVLGYLLPTLISLIYKLIRGQMGMGGGDFVLLAMIGAHTGPSGVLVSFLVAVLMGSIIGIAIMVRSRSEERGGLMIPFGPFLACGGIVALFWGPWIVDTYLRLSGLA